MNINDQFKYAKQNNGIAGRKRPKTIVDWLIIISGLALALIALYFLFIAPWRVSGAEVGEYAYPVNDTPIPPRCALHDVVCEGEINEPIKQVRYEEVLLTKYGKESCTNKECRTANGDIAHVGGVACRRDIKLGTSIFINGERFICNDRYALWLDKVRRYPTVDIYTDTPEDVSLAFGIQKATVAIIQ